MLAYAAGADFKTNSGHTEWVDSRAHQTGVTVTLTPNTQVLVTVGDRQYDVDFNSSRMGTTVDRTTYAAVTSRSYHPSGVMVSRVDGSVTFMAGDGRPANLASHGHGRRRGNALRTEGKINSRIADWERHFVGLDEQTRSVWGIYFSRLPKQPAPLEEGVSHGGAVEHVCVARMSGGML